MFPLGCTCQVCSASCFGLMERMEFFGHFWGFVGVGFILTKGFLFPDFLNHMVTKPLFLNFFFLSFGNTGWSLTEFPDYGHLGKKQVSFLRKEGEGKTPFFSPFLCY